MSRVGGDVLVHQACDDGSSEHSSLAIASTYVFMAGLAPVTSGASAAAFTCEKTYRGSGLWRETLARSRG